MIQSLYSDHGLFGWNGCGNRRRFCRCLGLPDGKKSLKIDRKIWRPEGLEIDMVTQKA